MLAWRKWCLDGSEVFITVLSSKFAVWVAWIFHIRTKKKPKAFSVGDRHSSNCLLPLFLCRLPRIPLKAPFPKWHVSPFCYSAANCFSDVKSLHKYLCTWPDRHQSHRTYVTKSPKGISQLGRSWNIRGICWETFCRPSEGYRDASWALWYLLQRSSDRL